MSYFKAKMHQIRFRLGLRPRPRCVSLHRSPDPVVGFTSKRREGGGARTREGTGRGQEGRGEGRKGKGEGERREKGRVGRGRRMGIAHPLFSA